MQCGALALMVTMDFVVDDLQKIEARQKFEALHLPKVNILSERQAEMQRESDSLFARVNDVAGSELRDGAVSARSDAAIVSETTAPDSSILYSVDVGLASCLGATSASGGASSRSQAPGSFVLAPPEVWPGYAWEDSGGFVAKIMQLDKRSNITTVKFSDKKTTIAFSAAKVYKTLS